MRPLDLRFSSAEFRETLLCRQVDLLVVCSGEKAAVLILHFLFCRWTSSTLSTACTTRPTCWFPSNNSYIHPITLENWVDTLSPTRTATQVNFFFTSAACKTWWCRGHVWREMGWHVKWRVVNQSWHTIIQCILVFNNLVYKQWHRKEEEQDNDDDDDKSLWAALGRFI